MLPVHEQIGKYARGLRLAAISLGSVTVGLTILVTRFGMQPFNRLAAGQREVIVWVAMGLIIVGGFSWVWAKWRCYEFLLPIRGAWLLQVSVWTDILAFVLRQIGRSTNNLWLGVMASVCALVAWLCFLCFLRSLMNLISRPGLRRLATTTIAMSCMAPVGVLLIRVGVKGWIPLTAFLVAAIGFVLTIPLLLLTARALADLSRHMRSESACVELD